VKTACVQLEPRQGSAGCPFAAQDRKIGKPNRSSVMMYGLRIRPVGDYSTGEEKGERGWGEGGSTRSRDPPVLCLVSVEGNIEKKKCQ